MTPLPVAIAGVDGCKRGWVAAIQRPTREPEAIVHETFAALLESLPDDAIVAVDMPIGLPERTGPGGRGPERLVREHLGKRRPSVFSVPSRAAGPLPADLVETLRPHRWDREPTDWSQ